MNPPWERTQSQLDTYDEHQEFVKCVVVGDTSVGKTRLICSYVHDQPGIPVSTLYQKPHIPTVFAIDQYSVNPLVRKRARVFLHGVPVQIRIWDTFGDHEKNRKFAYQNAHVVVLCYSIGMASSLRNVNARWYSEIKKYCPRAPIILVGTQLDRRHTDPCAFKSVSQVTTLTDILTYGFNGVIRKNAKALDAKPISPEVGRQTSREINASAYLEVSIVTKHGVNEVFENAIRSALICRRHHRAIFSSHLKRIKRPLPQLPYLPVKLEPPDIKVPIIEDETSSECSAMLNEETLCDITFLVDNELVHAHCVTLISGCYVFSALLTHPQVMAALGYAALPKEDNNMNVCLTEGYINGVLVDGIPRGFETIDLLSDPLEKCKVFVKVKNVSANDFKSIMIFLYSGKISYIENPVQFLQTVTYLQMDLLQNYVSNMLSGDLFLNIEIQKELHLRRCTRLYNLFYKSPQYADVAFLVDSAIVPAHKQVLVTRSPMMAGMFRHDSFKESLTRNVSIFSGIYIH